MKLRELDFGYGTLYKSLNYYYKWICKSTFGKPVVNTVVIISFKNEFKIIFVCLVICIIKSIMLWMFNSFQIAPSVACIHLYIIHFRIISGAGLFISLFLEPYHWYVKTSRDCTISDDTLIIAWNSEQVYLALCILIFLSNNLAQPEKLYGPSMIGHMQ